MKINFSHLLDATMRACVCVCVCVCVCGRARACVRVIFLEAKETQILACLHHRGQLICKHFTASGNYSYHEV